MTIQVILLQSPLNTSKAESFLKLQQLETSLKWSFVSTNPLRRAQMRQRGARNIINPLKGGSQRYFGAVWLDEWQSFLGAKFEEHLYEIFSEQGVSIVVLSQSFRLSGEEGCLEGWLAEIDCSIYRFSYPCPRYILSSSVCLIHGLKGFAKNSFILRDPYHIPQNRNLELLLPFCITEDSHLLSLARDYSTLVFKGPSCFYWVDILLWALGGHWEASLIGSRSENENRRHIDKEGSLSGSPPHWRVPLKKWKKSFYSFLRRTRWGKENEAHHFGAWENASG